MKKRVIEFTCPRCGASFYLCRDTYLLISEGSVEDVRLDEGTFFAHQCSRCGQLFDLEYPLVVRDPQKGFTLVLADRLPEGWQGQAVLVKNSAQLQKAYAIVSRGLPLKETLALWKYLERREAQICRLKDVSLKDETVWFECAGRLIGIHAEKWKFNQNRLK